MLEHQSNTKKYIPYIRFLFLKESNPLLDADEEYLTREPLPYNYTHLLPDGMGKVLGVFSATSGYRCELSRFVGEIKNRSFTGVLIQKSVYREFNKEAVYIVPIKNNQIWMHNGSVEYRKLSHAMHAYEWTERLTFVNGFLHGDQYKFFVKRNGTTYPFTKSIAHIHHFEKGNFCWAKHFENYDDNGNALLSSMERVSPDGLQHESFVYYVSSQQMASYFTFDKVFNRAIYYSHFPESGKSYEVKLRPCVKNETNEVFQMLEPYSYIYEDQYKRVAANCKLVPQDYERLSGEYISIHDESYSFMLPHRLVRLIDFVNRGV